MHSICSCTHDDFECVAVIIYQTLMCHNCNYRSTAKFNYVGLMNISTTLQMSNLICQVDLSPNMNIFLSHFSLYRYVFVKCPKSNIFVQSHTYILLFKHMILQLIH